MYKYNLNKGFTLFELMVSVAILSILVLMLIEVMLLYSKINRKYSFMSNTTIQARNLLNKIEREIILAQNLSISQEANGSTLIIGKQQEPKYIYKFLKNPRKIIIISPNQQKQMEINIKREMYIVLQSHIIDHIDYNNYRSLCFFYEVKCYVYNKHDKNFSSKPQLVHYIGITKF